MTYKDFLHVRKDGELVNSHHFVDKSKSTKAHEDFIQLIPRDRKNPRAHFFGATLDDVIVESNVMIAKKSKRQCVFASDGVFNNLCVLNNFMSTKGAHFVTLSGLMSGTISGNSRLLNNGDVVPAPVKLYPLRIGGGLFHEIVYVTSFKKGQFKYEPIKGDWKKSPESFDNRKKKFTKKDYFLKNFDYEGFYEEALKIKDRDIEKFANKVGNLALEFGEVY